jgi:hypothetical protein
MLFPIFLRLVDNMKNQLVILTCTVRTKMTTGMKRFEEDVRREDYIKAIRAWSKLSEKLGFRILVAENSNSLESLKSNLVSIDNSKLEFVQTQEDQISHIEGNSAGEFKILKEILDMGLIPEYIDMVWKVTGRLYVRNFQEIVPPNKPDFVVNRFYSPSHLIDTRVIGFSKKSYQTFFSQDPKFTSANHSAPIQNRGTYSSFEHLATIEILHSEIGDGIVKTMTKVPIFTGYSATSNKQIDGTLSRFKKRVTNHFRPIIVKLLVGSTP